MFVQSTSAVLPAFRAEPPFSMVSARAEVGSRRLASVRGCLSARTGPTRYYEITDDEKVASRNRTEGAVAAKLKARQLLHYRPSTSIMYEPVTRVA
jgi:hypothetical protein